MRDGGHVQLERRRGAAREGGEHAGGGHGGESFEREGEFGNFGEGDRGREEEEGGEGEGEI